MNRIRILKALSKSGFTGKTLEEAQSFIKSQNIELLDGKTVMDEASIAKAWETKAALVVEADDKIDQEVEKKAVKIDDEDGVEDAPAEKSAESLLRESRKATAEGAKSVEKIHAPALGGRFAAAMKRYESKVKSTANLQPTDPNRAAFDNAEDALKFGAAFRLGLCAAAGHKIANYAEKANDLAIIGKAQSAIVSNSGAVLIPEEYVAQLIWLTEQYGGARKLFNVVSMATDQQKRPRKTAIPAMQATASGAQITGGTISLDLVTLNALAFKLLIQAPNDLLEDSAVNVADIVGRSFAESQAITEDQCCFIGDGSATYNNFKGLASALPATAYINASGAAWPSVTEADIEGAIGSLQYVNTRNIKILTTREFYYQRMRPLAFGKGGVNAAEATNGVPLPGNADAAWKGTPVYFSEVLPTASASTSKFLYVGDFASCAMLGVRNDLRIDSDESLKFDYDSIVWRARSRFAVNVHGAGRGETFGPVVSLVTT